jgi:cell division protein FtsB
MVPLLKPLGYIAAFALALAYLFILFRSPQGLPTVFEKHRQVQEMEKANEAMREEIQRMRKRLEDISSRWDEKERIIRERTNKAKPGETIIYLPESGAGAEAPPPPAAEKK